MMTRDDMIRESKARAGTFPALAVFYTVIIATMAGTALAIV